MYNNLSFYNFDQFINNIVQYLTISKQTNPIELHYKSFYYTDESIKISAKIYDSNFNLDLGAQLKLNFDNENNDHLHDDHEDYDLEDDDHANEDHGNYFHVNDDHENYDH